MGSRSDNFFSWVWKVNGLLVLGLCLAALATIITLTFNIELFRTRDRPEQKVIQVAGADIRADDLELGEFREVKGTSLLYATLAAKEEHISSGSSYGRGDARNLLFFDTVSKKTHWLLKGNEQMIPSVAFITNPATEDYEYASSKPCDKDLVTQGILLEVAPLKNGKNSTKEVRQLALASPDGTELITVANGIDGLLGKHKTSSDALLAFYSVGGTVRVAEIDTSTRVVKSDNVLSNHD